MKIYKTLGPLIGKGNTADVFDVGQGKVVKLFHVGYPASSVHKEFINSRMINGLDVPVVQSHELITFAGRHGIVYDKLDAVSLLDMLLSTYDIEQYTLILARLHKRILSQDLRNATSCKEVLRRNIQNTELLDEQRKEKLYTVLDALADGDCFCHGDFHFANVLMAQQEFHIIDFMNVCRGHRHYDIARTVYLIGKTPVPTEMQNKAAVLQMKERAVDIYLKEMGVSKECLADWLTVIAAARLSELNSAQIEETNIVLDFLAAQGLD